MSSIYNTCKILSQVVWTKRYRLISTGLRTSRFVKVWNGKKGNRNKEVIHEIAKKFVGYGMNTFEHSETTILRVSFWILTS